MEKRLRKLILGLVLGSGVLAHAATLSAPGLTANVGDTVSMPLSISSPDQAISGVQFDLSWDAPLDVHVRPSTRIGTSGKVFYVSTVQPGLVRCMITGMNGKALSDGELIQLFATVKPGALLGLSHINLANLIATTPNGDAVPMQGTIGGLQILSGGVTQGIQPGGILNAASLTSGAISPGEVITVFGSTSSSSPAILINGAPAPIIYAGSNQVNAVVPFGLDLSGPATVEIRGGALSAKTSVPVAPASPAIFTMNSTGTGPAAILNQDYSTNSSSTPAERGSAIMIYATGFGMLSPAVSDGQVAGLNLSTTTSLVTASVGGFPAEVLYAGVAPGVIVGIMQINVRLPDGVGANPAAPLALSIGSFTTPAGVTVAIR